MSQNFIHSSHFMVPQEHSLQLEFDLELESGELLHKPILAYQTWGKRNEDDSNTVWVCHALTGNHQVQDWWGGLFGNGKCFDPNKHFIVAVNVLSSAYGSTGPLSFDLNGNRYYTKFPLITIRDIVAALEHVRIFLEIKRVQVLIGASLGGQQALEWAVQQPSLFASIIPIATNAQHSPFGIAFNEAQRLAIEADPSFYQNQYFGGRNGMIAARAIGMLSYRTYEGFEITQKEEDNSKITEFKAASYQRYQGEKLANRFNAYSYWYLSKAMDSHNLARNRTELADVLAKIICPVLVVGIDSDVLFPIHEQVLLVKHIPNSRLVTLKSQFGHDGFLVETETLAQEISSFLESEQPTKQLA